MTDNSLFLGVDGGGSRCRAALVNTQGQLLGRGEGGSAHPGRGLGDLELALLEAATGALASAGLTDCPLSKLQVVAGIAGLHLPRFGQLVEQWLHPFASVRWFSDLDIACRAAHGEQDGGVIIMGTGVSAQATVKGERLDIAGHGFPHSGRGAGHWLGYEAVSAILAASDGLGPSTIMSALVYDKLSIPQDRPLALADYFYQAPPGEFAKLAPLVFAAAKMGDATAIALRDDSVDYLESIALRMMAFGVKRLCLVGGIAEALQEYLQPGIKQLLVEAVNTPEVGAALMARATYYDSV